MKLNKKLTSILVTGAMIASIGGTTAMTSFATDTAAASEAAKANIVKYLEMANGVTNPNEAFTFEFKQVENGAPAVAIADATITPATTTSNTADEGAVYGTVSFTDVLKNANFEKAGVYEYVVSEKAGTNEEMTYDDSSYTIQITVKNKAGGGLEVTDIIGQKNEVVPGEEGETPQVVPGAKVDLTVTDPTVKPDGELPGKDEDNTEDPGSEAENGITVYGLTFDNNYQKTISEDPENIDPDPTDPSKGNYGVLGVTKTVVGDFADKVTAYPFEITMQAPANYTGEATVDAYIYTGDTKGDKVVVNLKGTTPFELADGQALVFDQLPAGMTYKVNEKLNTATVQNVDKYVASYAVLGDGAATKNDNAKGAALATEVIQMTDTNKDVATYTNTLEDEDVTPTGILMQNAPYILVATLAAGGLVIYLAKRREEEEEA